jgi:peptidoglycan/xylan/chitin deacetylase (PgdA/CDA1 family)
MLSLRAIGLAGATIVVVLGGSITGGSLAAASGPPAGSEGPAGPAARMPDGQVATPPAIRRVPADSTCPVPPSGPQFYAPGYPGYSRTVALTFDDGPGKTTSRILQILRTYRATATFFNIGQNMAARPALLRAEAREGFLLGNHTWSHPDLTKLTRHQQASQIDQATAEQHKITGTTPCVFRPPYGNYNRTTLSLARYRRMAVWLWSVDTEDWKAEGSASSYWVHRIIRLAEEEGGELEHPVIIMHNQPVGNPATALALPAIIRFFRDHHYRLVSLAS